MTALSTSRGSLKRAADDRTLQVYQRCWQTQSSVLATCLALGSPRGAWLGPFSRVLRYGVPHLLFLELVHLQNLAFSLQHVCIECVECVECGGAYKTRFRRKDVNTAQVD